MTDPMSAHTHTRRHSFKPKVPEIQRYRMGKERGGKGNQLDISIGGLLLLPHGEKEVGQVSQLLQPGVVWEGRFPKHEQFTS